MRSPFPLLLLLTATLACTERPADDFISSGRLECERLGKEQNWNDLVAALGCEGLPPAVPCDRATFGEQDCIDVVGTGDSAGRKMALKLLSCGFDDGHRVMCNFELSRSWENQACITGAPAAGGVECVTQRSAATKCCIGTIQATGEISATSFGDATLADVDCRSVNPAAMQAPHDNSGGFRDAGGPLHCNP